MPITCRDCGGTGWIPWSHENETMDDSNDWCETCGGEGVEYIPE